MLNVLIAIAVLYVGYAAIFFAGQRALVFPAQFRSARGPVPPDVERLVVEAAGLPVEAWLMRPPGDGRVPVLVFAHGNGELIDDWTADMRSVVARGVAVLLVEYPGFGRAAGKPSEASVTAALEAAYDVVAAHAHVDPERIIGWGRSLGGGAICTLAARRELSALILQSTFTSIRAFAPRYGLPPFMVRDPFDNASVVEAYDGPLLIVHGRADDIVPVAHAERLFERAQEAQFIVYDAAHNDCPPEWGGFVDDLGEFLVEAGVVDAWAD